MCEPYHSIVQYEDPVSRDDDDDLSGQAGQNRFMHALQDSVKWARKIDKWMHFSRVGSGHHGAIANKFEGAGFFDVNHVLYETSWWNRTTNFDGINVDIANAKQILGQNGKTDMVNNFLTEQGDINKQRILMAAENYAAETSIGTVKKLRKFLIESLKASENKYGYFQRFINNLLSKKGKREFEKRLKVFGPKFRQMHLQRLLLDSSTNKAQKAINFMIGFTRKRSLLVPEWADDDSAWIEARSTRRQLVM